MKTIKVRSVGGYRNNLITLNKQHFTHEMYGNFVLCINLQLSDNIIE